MKRIKIFISSVQSEFAEERAMLSHYIRTDALLGKFFEPFIFEEVPANPNPVDHVYLQEVEQCDIYLGIYGNLYGYEDEAGVSPTEHEYDKAAELYKDRLIYIYSVHEDQRHEKEAALIRKVERDIVRKTFVDSESLRTSVYASLVRYLEEKEYIRWQPFDAAHDTDATLDALDEQKIRDFIYMARAKRNFALEIDTPIEKFLTHLDLLDDKGRLANAALLLFGKKPQKYFITSEVKCAQFYGNVVEKPFPSYQIYRGDVFELVDQATSFVMSRVDNWVGTRAEGDTASVPTHPELPYDAVKEAIVNAVCHRDYTSNASVQVMLFRNRLEVWNPGSLPFGLTVEKLHGPHKSLPTNPLLAEPMYWNGYIEKIGTGTEDIIQKCVDYGLPRPEFYQEEDFRVVIYRPEMPEDENVGENETSVQPVSSRNTPSEVEGEEISDKSMLNDAVLSDKIKINCILSDKIAKVSDKSTKTSDKIIRQKKTLDRLSDILLLAIDKTEISVPYIANYFNISEAVARKNVTILTSLGLLLSQGANKNRTYKIASEVILQVHHISTT